MLLRKLIDQIDQIKVNLIKLDNERNDESNESNDENKKLYLLLRYKELGRDLDDILCATNEINEICSIKTDSNFQSKLEDKQYEITKTADFMKTFTPVMMLYNMGLINRNWE